MNLFSFAPHRPGALLLSIAAITFSFSAPLAADLRPHTDSASPHLTPSWHHYEFFNFRVEDDSFPLQIAYVGALPDEMDAPSVEESVSSAIQAWNQVPCSYAEFEWIGIHAQADDLPDSAIPISLVDSFGDNPPTIARTQFLDFPPPDGTSILLNGDDYRWHHDPPWNAGLPEQDPPIIAMDAAVAHELGHVIGLDHTQAHRAATMAANYLFDASQRTLSADDKLGACELYSTEGDECSTDGDCPPGADCVSGPDGSVCDIYLAPPGAYCAADLLHCPHTCHIINDITATGYCSQACHHSDQCPATMRCDDGLQLCRLDTGAQSSTTTGCHSTPSHPSLPMVLFSLLLIATRWTPASLRSFAQRPPAATP